MQNPAARVAERRDGGADVAGVGEEGDETLGHLGEGQVALSVVGDDVDEHRGSPGADGKARCHPRNSRARRVPGSPSDAFHLAGQLPDILLTPDCPGKPSFAHYSSMYSGQQHLRYSEATASRWPLDAEAASRSRAGIDQSRHRSCWPARNVGLGRSGMYRPRRAGRTALPAGSHQPLTFSSANHFMPARPRRPVIEPCERRPLPLSVFVLNGNSFMAARPSILTANAAAVLRRRASGRCRSPIRRSRHRRRSGRSRRAW